jgi:molybdopterin synthase sulfur carrier subunit
MVVSTAEVEVAFYGGLRPVVGQHLQRFELHKDSTVGELLAELVRHNAALSEALLDKEGRPRDYVHVFVNGRDHPYLPQRLDTVLEPGDRVDIFPPTAGGRA